MVDDVFAVLLYAVVEYCCVKSLVALFPQLRCEAGLQFPAVAVSGLVSDPGGHSLALALLIVVFLLLLARLVVLS